MVERPPRRYPLLESLYPAEPAVARADPLRRPGAPVLPRSAIERSGTSNGIAPTVAPADLLDFLVYGTDEAGDQEVHLSFREEVMAGVYLKLRFEPGGVRAIFLVRDPAGRRLAAAYGEELLARLARKGLRVAGVDVEEVDIE